MKKRLGWALLIFALFLLIGYLFRSHILRLIPFSFLKTQPPIHVPSHLPETYGQIASEKTDSYVLSKVSVIPMDQDTILRDHHVLIENGRIAQISPSPIKPPDLHTELVDARGMFLIPGLADMHIHLNDENNLLLMIANGVTTTRNMAGLPFHLDLKQRIESGELLGPHLYTTSPIMEGPRQIWRNNPGSVGFSSTDSVIAAVRRYKAMGYDFLKVYHSLTPELYLQIIHTAGVEDIPVVGHLPINVPLEQTLASTHYSIEHISPGQWGDISPELSLEIKSAMIGRSRKWICPTLIVNKKMGSQAGDPGLPDSYREYVDGRTLFFWDSRLSKRPNQYDLRLKMLGLIRENGGKVLAGTDAINAYILHGFSLHEELQELVGAGLTPFEALEAATIHSAIFLGQERESGTVSEGKIADLVLLRANPLEDISHTTHIQGVFVKGKLFDRRELNEMLEEVKKSY